jgi:hypothetical protein
MSRTRSVLGALASSTLVLALAGCDSASVGVTVDSGVATATFSSSGSPAVANQVRLVGRPTAADEVTVDVVIAGPTTSQDVFAFSFGLHVDDPATADFIEHTQIVGPALDTTGCFVPPIALVSASGSDPRLLLVSVTKLNPCPGNPIAAGEEKIISLTFRVEPDEDTTIRLCGQSAAGNPSASDSHGARISSVTFDPADAVFLGR